LTAESDPIMNFSRIQIFAALGVLAIRLLTPGPAFCQTAQPSSSSPSAAASPSSGATLNCGGTPVTMTFGGTSWQVRGCNDRHSVVIMAPHGSAAAPFYFLFYWKGGLYTLTGEGTGNKQVSGRAYEELRNFSRADIDALVAKAKVP
jgi:hypothetical protein